MDRLKVAVVADYAEEGWASMDLVAEMLATRLTSVHQDVIDARLIRPRFARPLTRFGSLRRSKSAFNAERALNRYLLYPLWLRRQRGKFTLFHIVDHSYSHLTNHLPADRTIITCHDIDAFKCPSYAVAWAAFRDLSRDSEPDSEGLSPRRDGHLCEPCNARRDCRAWFAFAADDSGYSRMESILLCRRSLTWWRTARPKIFSAAAMRTRRNCPCRQH